MKKKHFLIFILLLPLFCKAQPYQSIFGQESTEWYIASNRLSASDKEWPFGTDHTYVQDTVEFEGKIWHQILFPGHHSRVYCNENLTSGKIIARLSIILPFNDMLICDMSLQKSDTFKMPLNFSETINIIVDTVYYEGGRKIIAFNRTVGFDSTGHQLKFIEGMGPTNGILEMVMYYGYHGNTVLCAKKDGNYTFNSGLLGGRCTYDVDGIANEDKSKFYIWPNPADEKLNFQNVSGKNIKLRIFNQLGKTIMKTTTSSQELNIEGLKPGLYFIEIENNPIQHFLKL